MLLIADINIRRCRKTDSFDPENWTVTAMIVSTRDSYASIMMIPDSFEPWQSSIISYAFDGLMHFILS